MPSTGETATNVLILVFVSCGFVACVGCTSALLKKFYDKYILKLPEVVDAQPANIFENRYVKAHVSIVISEPMVEPTLIDLPLEDDESEENVVAIEIV
jgi:hypothetical protein